MRRNMRLFVALLTLTAVLLTLGGAVAQDKKILYTGRQMGPDDIPTLDPAVASDVPSVNVISEIFPELYRLHEENATADLGMAENVTISEDGLTYTFDLLNDIYWVRYNPETDAVEQVLDDEGNPRVVTASDFKYTMIRTMDPLLATDYAYVAAKWIAGGAEFQTSDPEASAEDRQAAIDAVGITVVDDNTLEIQVTKPSVAISQFFTMWITTATPEWLIEEMGDVWIEPENIASYGPYAVKSWNHGLDLTMIKNPFWPGTDTIPQAKIDEVVFQFLDLDPQFAAFEAGSLQVSEVPPSAVARIKADPSLNAGYFFGPGSCTYYYGFNQDRAPFDDARVVRALSAAIDRQAIVDNVTQAGELPAYMFALPSMNAAPRQEDYPDQLVQFDPEYAQAQLQEYLDETGMTADQISGSILINNSSLHQNIAEAVQQMWSETLGVNIQVSAQEFGVYLDQRRDADIFRAGWCFDYPDSDNWYFDVFHTSVDPDTHFNNAEYDALVEAAALSTDVEERTALYAQADAILTNTDAAIAPIYYYVTDDITAPGIERTNSIISREYYEKWDITGAN